MPLFSRATVGLALAMRLNEERRKKGRLIFLGRKTASSLAGVAIALSLFSDKGWLPNRYKKLIDFLVIV
jgi:hypothetical protein